ncbi:hypothetical protein MA9V2_017 [Chryseobacterium phage MA9V-2]|nr:hypothetical protein MA9V2_017 [Chryseobacterium phage MA9V-2]
MAFNVITLMDANVLVEKTRNIDILSDNKLFKLNTTHGEQVWSSNKATNNSEASTFTREYIRPVLVGKNSDGFRPVAPTEIVADGNAQLLCNIHNVFISSFDFKTLYSNAYSATLEIYQVYDGKEIILSSNVLALMDFRLSKFDLEYANRFYSTYCPVQVVDLTSMLLSKNPDHIELVSQIIDVPSSQINEALLSNIHYRFAYIDESTITVPPTTAYFEFDITEIVSRPESPASWALEGDLNVLVTRSGRRIQIGLDQSNPDLMNTLTQIVDSVELLSITYDVTFTSYKSTVDPNDFEYQGVHYEEIGKYSITCANTFEPVEPVTLLPDIADSADLLSINVLMQITSSRNTISLSKTYNQLFLGTDLSALKNIVYNIQAEQFRINNVIETTQNVVTFNNTSGVNTIAQRNSLQFVTLKAVHINDFDSGQLSTDATETTLYLRTTPMMFAVKFISDVDFDLRKYEAIEITYNARSQKPTKIEKDVLYFQLGWQDATEIAVVINGVVATVLGAQKAF